MYSAIYIHIPFCQSKCIYCDFPSYPELFPQYVEDYLTALCSEIERADIELTEYATLYIGGGTPSLLTPEQMRRLLTTVKNKGWRFTEASMEANPGTVTAEKLYVARQLGINRISFGVQSFRPELLKTLSRIHTPEQAVHGIELARRAGFENINLDLMYGLPAQSPADLEQDLAIAVSLNPEHLSCYGLKVESGTGLEKQLRENTLKLPTEDMQDIMYESVPKILAAQGYVRYEISNYAKTGRECLHNMVYWRYLPYKAFGVSGCSFDGSARYTNTFDVLDYIERIKKSAAQLGEREVLPQTTQYAEYVFMNLRKTEGVSPELFKTRFGESLYKIYGAILDKYVQNKLLYKTIKGDYALTAQGFKYSNVLFSDLLL